MSEAYVCDRCDSLGKGEPAARIVAEGDGPGAANQTTKQLDTSRGGSLLDSAGSPRPPFGSDPSQTSVRTTTVEWADLCTDCAAAFEEWWDVDEDTQEPVTDGGRVQGPPPRLIDDPADWPTTIDTAVARLTEDDPTAVFLVTGRPTESGDGAWTGATVGVRDDLADDTHQALVDDVVEHILATLLLETDWSAADLAEQLGEIEAGLAADGGSP